MNKRGISPIVGTVLIILLVLVGVGAVAVSIRNLVSDSAGKLPSAQQCTQLNLRITECKIKQNQAENQLEVLVERGVGQAELEGIRFVFDTGTKDEIKDEMENIPELGSKRFTFKEGFIDKVSSVKVTGIIDSM